MKTLMIRDNGLVREATRAEAAALMNTPGVPVAGDSASAITFTVNEVFPGAVIIRSGATGAMADVLPIATALTAANPDIANGESFIATIDNRNTSTGTITLTASTGTTLASGARATIATATTAQVLMTRTSATAWTFAAL